MTVNNTIVKIKSIDPLLRRIESQREWITNYVKGIPVEHLNASPSPGKWSILEIIRHLYLSEKYSLDYLKKKWSYTHTLKKAGILTWLRSKALNISMRQPAIKMKAPVVARVKKEIFDPVLLLDQWLTTRKELFDFLNSLPEEVFTMEFYKHPVAGKMRLDHMLDFFYYHTQRHIGQIKKNPGK